MSREEEQTKEYETALAILDGARSASEQLGISPGSWVLAVIDELAFMSYTQRDEGISSEVAFDTINALLREGFADLERNPPPKQRQRTPIRVQFIDTSAGTLRPPLDDIDRVINRAIRKGSKL